MMRGKACQYIAGGEFVPARLLLKRASEAHGQFRLQFDFGML
jgi:hypothetical protein